MPGLDFQILKPRLEDVFLRLTDRRTGHA